VRATFVFVPRAPATPGLEAASATRNARPARDVTPLLLEKLRRHDELRRASVIVPDDAQLGTTDRPPRAVAATDDIDLIISFEKVGWHHAWDASGGLRRRHRVRRPRGMVEDEARSSVRPTWTGARDGDPLRPFMRTIGLPSWTVGARASP
jgi:hypothetical protein